MDIRQKIKEEKEHIRNLGTLDDRLHKLEYLVDSGINYHRVGIELQDVIDDIQDEYTQECLYDDIILEEYGRSTKNIEEPETPQVRGKLRRLIPDGNGWEVDELGNVYTTRDKFGYRQFSPNSGYWIKTKNDAPKQYLASLMLTLFEVPKYHERQTYVLYRDGDISNVSLDNLRWIDPKYATGGEDG